MSETAKEKTTREFTKQLAKHHFRCLASVFILATDVDERIEVIARVKRLIKEDNPDVYILYLITTHTDAETGEIQIYVAFFSWESLIGAKLRNEQQKNLIAVVGESVTRPNRRYISCGFSAKRMQGWINTLRREGVYDLSGFFGVAQVKRYGFINRAKKPTDEDLRDRREEYEDQYACTLH